MIPKTDKDGLDLRESSELSHIGRDKFIKTFLPNLGRWALVTGTIFSIFSPKSVKAQTSLLETPVDALQFLLKMAYLQDQFYSPNTAYSFFNSSIPEYNSLLIIQKQEKAQINFLQNAITNLGGIPVTAPAPGYYNFAAFTSLSDTEGSFQDYSSYYPTFLACAQFIEDTVNRAYLGQMSYLLGNSGLLNQVAGMNSVHARHSAFIRQVRGNSINNVTQDSLNPATPLKPWISLDGNTAAGSTITNSNNLSISVNPKAYSGEANETQALIQLKNVNHFSVINDSIATESFDEPLSYSSANNLLNSFIAPTQ